jgi:hypothetical protein
MALRRGRATMPSMGSPRPSKRESGQAAVETALTMPLALFLILGTLQLFMVLQARIMAQYAVYKAVRAGSLNHGNCTVMKHAALLALMPTITPTDSPAKLVQAFTDRKDNKYDATKDLERRAGIGGFDGQIVEIYRVRPTPGAIGGPFDDDYQFDQPGINRRLDVRMLYWYHLKIPFADWVIGKIMLANFGVQDYTAINPYLVTQTAKWKDDGSGGLLGEPWPGGSPTSTMGNWAASGHYVVPIRVSASMRMMTPAKKSFFPNQECPL